MNSCPNHPVLSVIAKRARSGSVPGQRGDPYRVALALEGGAMRGVISGGMVAGLEALGLLNAFDVIYGTSAGAMAGAYFIARQARYGTTIYYENINNRHFINFRRFPRRPVVDLGFLFDAVIGKRKFLDCETILDSAIPLRPVATSVDELGAHVFDDSRTPDDILKSLRASATMALVAGPPFEVEGRRYLDGSISEPIPVHSATQDGATHILALVTRPQGRLSRNTLVDRLVIRRMLDRIRRGLGDMYLRRVEVYRNTLAWINAQQTDPSSQPQVYIVQLPQEIPELSRVEKSRAALVRSAAHGMSATIGTFRGNRAHMVERLTAYDEKGRQIPPIDNERQEPR